MDKCVFCFVVSYLKKAIFNLECANKLTDGDGVVADKLIDELKKL